jgi:purine-nucleoside phosphorylase
MGDSMNDQQVQDAAARMNQRLGEVPEVLAVLGSGLGFLADALTDPVEIPMSDLEGLPAAGVAGHSGRFVCGILEGRRVLVQSGRFHLYEGHAPAVVVAPVRIAAALGVRTLVVTNAAGGVNPAFTPGTIMLIEDHLNLTGVNPLVGPTRPGEPRFPDMSRAWDPALRALARECAGELDLELARGTYAAVLGPSYETPAEVCMLAALGADAVGMSTVPEVIAARSAGLRVLGLSLITNAAAGVTDATLSHDEVLAAGREAAPRFERLLRAIMARL